MMAIPTQRGREISRLEAFSDAVFALSATLLVVSIDMPPNLEAMLESLKGFFAFALSFAALVLIWTVHNAFFRRYGLQDGWTIFLNSCLLLVVLFYVYPLKYVATSIALLVAGRAGATRELVGGLDRLGDLFVLYGLGFTAIFLCVSLLYLHAHRRRDVLGLDAVERHEARQLAGHYGLFVLVGLLSIATARAGIGLRFGLPGWMYALIGPLAAVYGWRMDRRRPGSPAGDD